jgi:hypothetical protein
MFEFEKNSRYRRRNNWQVREFGRVVVGEGWQ